MARFRHLCLATSLLLGCAPARAPGPSSKEAPGALDRLRHEADHARWHYVVTAEDDLEDLVIEASLEGAASPRLGVDRPAERFLYGVEVLRDDAWRPALVDDGEVVIPDCQRRCRLRYRFALRAAAEQLRDEEVADWEGGTALSPPSAWLLRPPDRGVPYVFRVPQRPSGLSFVSGVWPDAQAAGAFGGDSADLWRSPYSAFGRFRREQIAVAGSQLEVAIAGEPSAIDAAATLAWIDHAAKIVAGYFGRFPLPRALVLVVPRRGQRIGGRQIGGGGAAIILQVGEQAGPMHFARDWVAVHEMIHLAVPAMPRRHLWLTEGLATYVEPLARARRGELPVATVWRDMLRGMPHGLPEEGDEGLDRTATWGRTYWGGALFALTADLAIREQTGGAKSLDDALRAVVQAGGHNGVSWPMRRFLAEADRGTGTRVLSELYAKWSVTPVTVDLESLWEALGVHVEAGGEVRFDDEAPRAALRRALTQPRDPTD